MQHTTVLACLVCWLLLACAIGVCVGQAQPAAPSPDDQLARCQGQLHAVTKAHSSAVDASGDIAIELRKVMQQRQTLEQERDALKRELETLRNGHGPGKD